MSHVRRWRIRVVLLSGLPPGTSIVTGTGFDRVAGRNSVLVNTVRLLKHVATGKITKSAALAARRIAVPGGKTAREIAEQLKVDELGGIRVLANEVNPIGAARRSLMQSWRGQDGDLGEYLRWLGFHLP